MDDDLSTNELANALDARLGDLPDDRRDELTHAIYTIAHEIEGGATAIIGTRGGTAEFTIEF